MANDYLTENRTTRININRMNITPNDYYKPVMDYFNPFIDYYNPVIDYYNLFLSFEPCLNQLGLILILCKININRINIFNLKVIALYCIAHPYCADFYA